MYAFFQKMLNVSLDQSFNDQTIVHRIKIVNLAELRAAKFLISGSYLSRTLQKIMVFVFIRIRSKFHGDR